MIGNTRKTMLACLLVSLIIWPMAILLAVLCLTILYMRVKHGKWVLYYREV